MLIISKKYYLVKSCMNLVKLDKSLYSIQYHKSEC